MANFINIIPVVEAQSADAVAQPTFGPIEVGGGSTVSSSVLIRSDKTAVKVGDTFKVKVEIKTNNITINEYKVVVDFDPNLLSVMDQDSNTQGTQVSLLDTVFQVSNPVVNNTVLNGRVIIDAKAASGNAFQVNRDVVEVQFQAQASGSATIKLTQGADGTQLTKLEGNSVSFTSNEITTLITSQSGGLSSNSSTSAGFNSSISVIRPSSSSLLSSISPDNTVIPKTAITDNPELLFSLLIGLVLIITGISLTSRKNKNN